MKAVHFEWHACQLPRGQRPNLGVNVDLMLSGRRSEAHMDQPADGTDQRAVPTATATDSKARRQLVRPDTDRSRLLPEGWHPPQQQHRRRSENRSPTAFQVGMVEMEAEFVNLA